MKCLKGYLIGWIQNFRIGKCWEGSKNVCIESDGRNQNGKKKCIDKTIVDCQSYVGQWIFQEYVIAIYFYIKFK